MGEKKDKARKRTQTGKLPFLYFQCKYAEKILAYITVIFLLTGIIKFSPDILMKFVIDIDHSGMTLSECWQICFTPIVIMDIVWNISYRIYKMVGLTDILQSFAASILGYITVAAINYDGDILLVTYVFFWVIQKLSLWILNVNNYFSLNTDSMGTAICITERVKKAKVCEKCNE